MKTCFTCGNNLDDNASVCPNCGAPQGEVNVSGGVTYAQSGMNQEMMYGQQNMNQEMMYGQQNMNQGMVYGQQNMDQSMMYGQQNMNQGMIYGQQSMETEKPKKKKGLIIGIVVGALLLAIVAVALVLVLFVFSGKSKAKKAAKNYFTTLETLDVEKVIEASVPKRISKLAISMAGEELDEVQEEFDEGLEEAGVDGIEFKDVKIKGVEKTSFNEYYNNFFDALGMDEEIDELIADGDFDFAGNEFKSKEDVCDYAIDMMKDYDIDVDNMYLVEVEYELDIKSSMSEYEAYFAIAESSASAYVDKLLVYKSDKEYYVVPDITKITKIALASTLSYYINRSRVSTDISNANQISTVIYTAISNESAYDALDAYCDDGRCSFEFSKEGLSKIGGDFELECLSNIGDRIPVVKGRDDNKGGYMWVTVDLYELEIRIYTSGSDEAYELCPNSDYYGY